MKKFISIILVSLCIFGAVFAEANDTIAYGEISSAYNTGFFPGVVDKTNLLEKQYPDSAYLPSALILKGHSLIKMYRYQEAISTLLPLQKKFSQDLKNQVKVTYYLAQAYYLNLDYSNALQQFYEVCKSEYNQPYYAQSIFYSANIYFEQGDYNQSKALYEYVIQNGTSYLKSDYDSAVQKLLITYNRLEEYKKGTSLYNQLCKVDFDDEIFCNITLYAAESYENSGKEEKAYKMYSQVVQSGYKTPAVIAMKKAYVLANNGKVHANPADIFTTATQTFEDSPELVCDFWARLGIDEFEAKNYEISQEYFANAQALIDEGVYFNQEILTLYNAKYLIEAKQDFYSAENILGKLKKQIEDSPVINIQDAYYSTYIQCKALENKWQDIPDLFTNVKNPDVQTNYNYASALYNQQLYSECNSFLRDLLAFEFKNKLNSKNLSLYELYALTNTKQGVYSAAVSIYNQMEKQGLLNEENRVEYAKVLFNCYNYPKCLSVISDSNYAHKAYVSGLCKINQRSWQEARDYFISYIKEQSRRKDFNILAHFYKGYAEYNLGNTRDSYVTFMHFVSDAPVSLNNYICLAYEYGAKSALQNGDYRSAATNAEQLIRFSTEESAKQQAILFCSEIYSSIENYDKAIFILEPYTKKHDDFAVKCLFQIAKNYEKQKKINMADFTYTKIFTEFPESEHAEEAMYSLGGLYYARGEYVTAENRYNNYIYKFVEGKFSDAAFFYCADSELKMGATDKSIMMNRNLINNYPKSIYLYGAYKNLLNAYYKVEDYQNALSTAKMIVAQYPTQAAEDGIGRTVIELEQITKGTDKRVAEKQSEYERLGGSTTKQGRAVGTELVAIYASSEGSGMNEAFKLAKELFSKQTDVEEKYYAAKNADFIASYYRKKNENQKAAEFFLKAAELYRGSVVSESNETAAALYGAVEAFCAEGMISDASDTADLLVQLYPKSAYANRAKALVK